MTSPGSINKFSCSESDRFLCRGPFTIDLYKRDTLFNKKEIQLPMCAFDYLVTLLRHSPEPVSYKTLVADSQGFQLSRLEAQDLARVRIYMLRKVIEENAQDPCYILAVPGYGYRLVT
ncbi:MAG: DNA-binding response regulator [Chloroflexota bacterium]|nr:MAG: DNA-binding response regulator [Chloroflexota bacterium]